MIGGSKLRGGWAAIAVTGSLLSLGTAPAFAADLGGDCCADLEERVAELEATTARKGNRKVSLEVSGHVNEALIWWDDGKESNVYQVTNDNARTRFRFKGKAKINNDWEAGYVIEIGIRTANSKRFTQNNDEGDDTPTDVGLDLRDSIWYVKSKDLGTAWVGQGASSTDSITEVNLTQTKDFAKYSDIEDTGLGLLLRSSTNGGLSSLSWRRLLGDSGDQPGEGERRFNLVKWDSPTVAGFTASASWGEDDFWDIALRYAGEFAGLKVAAGIGYLEITDGPETKTECNARGLGLGGSDDSCQQFGGSVSVVHESSGLFVNVGAGQKTDDALGTTTVFAGTGADDESAFWSIQGGIEKKFIEHGKTTIYGEYYNYDGGAIARTIGAGDAINNTGGTAAIWNSEVESFGGGIAQGFDKAALVVYLSYRHVEGDLTLRRTSNGALSSADFEDLDLVLGGAIIKF